MGLGHLGGKTATMLQQLGLQVNGWSQSPKHFQGIRHFQGEAQFTDFLSNTDILICMLPLTPQTTHILNRHTFQHLRHGAYLINVGRGQHLVEQDLLDALASGQLSGACLDVFQHEPLPPDHPFWTHQQIKVTPHIASVTNPETAVTQLYDNYLRAISGQPMHNLVDVAKGY
jgi:glyoxylate/hydroxypyruvate reductase A